MLKLVKLEPKYQNQLNEMMDEWTAANEKIIPWSIRKSDYHNFETYLDALAEKEESGEKVPDSTISKEPDGEFNESYCKWCYTDGEFKYSSMEELIDFCVEHMSNENWPPEQVRAHMLAVVPQLKHWNQGEN